MARTKPVKGTAVVNPHWCTKTPSKRRSQRLAQQPKAVARAAADALAAHEKRQQQLAMWALHCAAVHQ